MMCELLICAKVIGDTKIRDDGGLRQVWSTPNS